MIEELPQPANAPYGRVISDIEYIQDNPEVSRLRPKHLCAEVEFGFDVSNFNDPEDFQTILEWNKLEGTHELLDMRDGKQGGSLFGENRPYAYHVWANEGVMLTARCNPLTGRIYDGNPDRPPSPGHASFIGISGKQGPATALLVGLRDRLSHYKGIDYTGREYI